MAGWIDGWIGLDGIGWEWSRRLDIAVVRAKEG